MPARQLLAIVEVGGYPNFNPLYQKHGFSVEFVNSVRKAQGWLKKHCPDVVVTEFNFDAEFRDRMSNLESLLATMQRYRCDARVIVLIEKPHLPRLEKVLQRYSVFEVLLFPVDEVQLGGALERAMQEEETS
ncbi:MAG TPA: hypothetical protein EYH03_03180 [Chromatiales bacterium]|nr:hypothetical protein [Chromatiales bacterium]